MKFNDKVYDILKWVTQIVLPATGTLYFAMAKIWNFPYAEEVVGTISAITAFLGITLGISNSSYKKDGMDGILQIDTSETVDKYSFVMDEDTLNNLQNKTHLHFKVATK